MEIPQGCGGLSRTWRLLRPRHDSKLLRADPRHQTGLLHTYLLQSQVVPG